MARRWKKVYPRAETGEVEEEKGGRGGQRWGSGGGGGAAGKGDHVQAPGDRRLGVALHCPPNINTLRFPASDGPDNHPLSTGTIWRQGREGGGWEEVDE